MVLGLEKKEREKKITVCIFADEGNMPIFLSFGSLAD